MSLYERLRSQQAERQRSDKQQRSQHHERHQSQQQRSEKSPGEKGRERKPSLRLEKSTIHLRSPSILLDQVPSMEVEDWYELEPQLWKRNVLFRLKRDYEELTSGSLFLKRYQRYAPLEDMASNQSGSQPAPWTFSQRYFDCETTGLSTGAGTYCFLFGLGVMEEESFAVSQYFMEDFPAEPQFLEAIADELKQNPCLFHSYNGRSYDLSLLRSRFLMNGMSFPELWNMDLLYPTRKLMAKTYSDCRLSSAEENLLFYERIGDIPSMLIPDRYFQYQRIGGNPQDYEPLQPVFEHHCTDIFSLFLLASLYGFLEQALLAKNNIEDRQLFFQLNIDRLALTELVSNYDPELALKIVEDIEKKSNQAMELQSAYLFHGRLLKRLRRYDDAHMLFQRSWDHVPGYVAGLELLKHLEHREKDYKAAQLLIDQIKVKDLVPRKEQVLRAFNHRAKRIEEKLNRLV